MFSCENFKICKFFRNTLFYRQTSGGCLSVFTQNSGKNPAIYLFSRCNHWFDSGLKLKFFPVHAINMIHRKDCLFQTCFNNDKMTLITQDQILSVLKFSERALIQCLLINCVRSKSQEKVQNFARDKKATIIWEIFFDRKYNSIIRTSNLTDWTYFQSRGQYCQFFSKQPATFDH